MLDGYTHRDRIIKAALKLAETRGWRDLSLGEIAAEAQIPLIEFRKEFQSKAQILAAFVRAVDLAVLEKFPAPGPDAARDRLFDVLLTRFEVMQPYKLAIRRISEDATPGEALQQFRPALKSQYWMLAAAGLSGEGGTGLVRVQGLLGIYGRVFRVWIDDDDPGLAKTMAALDKRLRRGESIMHGFERFRDGAESLLRGFGVRRKRKAEPQPESSPAAESGIPPAAPVQTA